MEFKTDIKETLKMCRSCFMCRHACPTFRATKLDSVTPRGFGLLLSRIDEGIVDWSEDVAEKIYQCSQCGLCKTLCEFHWPEDEMVRVGRKELVEIGGAPEKVKKAYSTIGRSPVLPVADKTFIGKKNADVLFYAGRVVAEGYPEIIKAAEKIFKAAKTDYSVLDSELPTGVELFELGYEDEAKTTAKKFADAIVKSGAKKIVTPCAHTYKALKKQFEGWGIVTGIEVFHTSEYLLKLIEEGRISIEKSFDGTVYAYHDPCQLGRGAGIFEQPRKVIEHVTGNTPLELFHNRKEAECCGAGSSMYLTDPDVAYKVADVRISGAVEDGSQILVTACPNCKMMFDKTGKIPVIDIVELVANAII